MSISRAWYVSCDQCGNPAEISTEGAKHARLLASRYAGYGRKRIDGRMEDLCAACLALAASPDGQERAE